MTPQITAVDHFAGTGWAVACRWLGILEYGVEIMKEAIFTRRAVGFRTIYRDVWSGLFHAWLVPSHDLYIASPPCQTFSVAGRGTGRKALDQVLMLIASGAWKDPAKLRAAGADLGDDRTALVLTPLAHIWAHRPRLVALEQVPTVLPVWEAMAEVLRGLGYSVWTGNLQAEQYGVPQTRKRAILMARLDGPVAPPVPTHSRYYSREPQRLDAGVQKWVSMAEALGWGMTARPYPTIATGTEGGGTDPAALGGSGARKNVYAERAAGRWEASGDVDNDSDGGVLRLQAADASTLQTFPVARKRMGAGMVERYGDRPGRAADEPAFTIRASAGGREPGGFVFESADGVARKMRPDEAAILQSYPAAGRVFTGQNSRVAGGDTEPYSKSIDTPAPTVTGQARSWRLDDGSGLRADEAAILQSFPNVVYRNGNQANAARRGLDAPAPTIHFGARSNKVEWIDADLAADPSASGVRVSTDEAARFQTFPVPFPFQGSKGKQFLQIGNAVPPLLAYAILSALIAPAASVEVEQPEPIVLAALAPVAAAEPVVVTHSTSADFAESRRRAVEKAERAFAKAEERLAAALESYDAQVAAHEKRGDGFFSESYREARKEAVLARKFQESKRSALATARAQASADRLGDL